MSVWAVCIIVAVTGQNWGTPTIQEAELAPPAGLTNPADAPANSPDSAKPVESQDMATSASGSASVKSEEPAREVNWQYDDEGMPVATSNQTGSDTQSAGLEKSSPEPPASSTPKQNSRKVQGSKSVATFWFVLPK